MLKRSEYHPTRRPGIAVVTSWLVFLSVMCCGLVRAECPPALVFTGEAAGDIFGRSVAGAGDVNNDGHDDLIVGASQNDAGGDLAGRAYVYCGMTGSLLYTFTGEAGTDLFGQSVAGAGDVDNDGFDDLIIGAHGNDAGGYVAGSAYVYSGLTGNLLYTFMGEAPGDRFGGSVAGAGDVNNDGYDDLIIGAFTNDAGGTFAGRAYVYSGLTGNLLYTFTGEAAGDRFGESVAGAGDVDNDGHDDLIIGANENDAGGSVAGRAYVYSGLTGGLLHTFTGEASGDEFGRSVAGAGDVDNDGHDDLIIGAEGYNAGGDYAGRAYVCSGLTGSLLYSFTGEAAGDHFGKSVAGAGDVNIDGHDDLIIGAFINDAGGDGAGRAYVYSGMTGSLLHTFTGETAADQLGYSVAGAGDVNNDGLVDLIIGAIGNDAGGTHAGRAYVFTRLGDTDNDAVADCEDNCPFTYNPGQADADSNGIGDACECACPFQDDFDEDGFITALDLSSLIDILFAGAPDVQDPQCPAPRGDDDCDGFSTALDLSIKIDHLFAGGDPPCDPCAP